VEGAPLTPPGRTPWIVATLLLLGGTGLFAVLAFPGLPGALGSSYAVSAFNLPHLWAFDHAARMLDGERPFQLSTTAVGYPGPVETRFIAWVPILMAAALRPIFGPVGAYNLVFLLGPTIAGLAAFGWIRRAAGAPPLLASAAALTFATSPYMLGCLASGQICKSQIWIFPAALLAQHESVAPDRTWRGRLVGLLALGATGLAAAFTEPTYALMLPFALGVAAAGRVLAGPSRLLSIVVLTVGLGLVAAGMYPAKGYYGDAATSLVSQAFHPADRAVADATLVDQVANWEQTILGQMKVPKDPQEAMHLTWMPWPLLVGGLWGLLRGGSAGRVGAGIAIVGATMAMGEELVHHGVVVRQDGHPVWLPMSWLAHAGYPLARSGMYYRAIAVPSAGLALALGAAGAKADWRGRALAVALALGAYGEGLYGTRGIWPRPVAELPAAAVAERIAALPGEGAVLDVPWAVTSNDWQQYLGETVLHGRPTNALPRALRPMDIPVLKQLDGQLRLALVSADPPAAIRALGFRFVVWHPFNDETGVGLLGWTRALGAPNVEGRYRWWDLGELPTGTPPR